MTKSEFLDGLRRALFSTNSESLINENIAFYSSYIDEEVRKGRSEEEVLDELGDPRLIARSIKDAEGINDDIEEVVDTSTSKNKYSSYQKAEQTYTDDYGNEIKKDKSDSIFKSFDMNKLGCISSIIIALILLGVVVTVLAYIVGGILQILAPVIGPILIIVVIIIFIQIFRRGQL